jgi:hypothetical protein
MTVRRHPKHPNIIELEFVQKVDHNISFIFSSYVTETCGHSL